MPAFARPVLISKGVGQEFSSSILLAEDCGLEKKCERELELDWVRADGLLVAAVWAKTVTSSFPLRP